MPFVTESQEFWLEFIELYKSFSHLWKIKSEKYKNRDLKAECFSNLLEKLKKINSSATKETVAK